MYNNSLKALRAKLLEGATGTPVAEQAGLESFIPNRKQDQASQPSTEDILAKAAGWLSEIRKASSELEARYSKDTKPAKSALASFVEGTKRGFETAREASEQKEAFIKRRSENSPSTYAPQRPSETPVPIDAEVTSVLNAIAAVESRGSGDYSAIGPVVKKGMYKGQRAYGRYQVMEANIGPWTEEALGKRLSVEEFLNSSDAQDAVAAHQLSKSKDEYGTWEDAASIWFSGRPMAEAGDASDGYTTVPEYITKFRKNFVRT